MHNLIPRRRRLRCRPRHKEPVKRGYACNSLTVRNGGTVPTVSENPSVIELGRSAALTLTSGNSTSDTWAEFKVKYVGSMEKLPFEMCRTLLEPPDLISYVDTAQQEGKLPFVAAEEEMFLAVSKYGIRVASADQCDVLQRHPLYLVVRMLCYEDGLAAGRNLLALNTTDPDQQECSIWVYQCSSAEQAQAICKVLSAAFDSALASDTKS